MIIFVVIVVNIGRRYRTGRCTLRVVVRFPGTTAKFVVEYFHHQKHATRGRYGAVRVAAARRGVALFAERCCFRNGFSS